MIDFLLIIPVVGLALIEYVECLLLSLSIDRLLEKDRQWPRPLFASLGILLFTGCLCTWLPGFLGVEVSYFDGEITLLNGALLQNLGFMLLLTTASLGLLIAKQLWHAMTGKGRLEGKRVGIEVVFAAAYATAGCFAVQDERVISLDDHKTAYVIALLIAAAALYSFSKKTLADKPKETAAKAHPAQEAAKAAPAQKTAQRAAAPAKPSAETEKEYRAVIAEADRLTKAQDYASQIPMLIKATGMALSGRDRARIWNYLGLAYQNTGSAPRAMECYRTALQFDNSPGAMNNLALLEANNRNYGRALQLMDAAIREAQKRGFSAGLYYANYASVLGRSGNRAAALENLNKAASLGCDAGTVEAIRRQIGAN